MKEPSSGPGYYAYLCREDGSEPLGTENKIISRRHTTLAGFRRFIVKGARPGVWKLFHFTAFFDERTFKLLQTVKVVKGDV